MAPSSLSPEHALQTSGTTDPVWIHTVPYKDLITFPKLEKDLETEVCIIGAGIAGISTAYELVKKGHKVVLVEARDVLSGETGRTSGHLASGLDDGYANIIQKHGEENARHAAESHQWALERVGQVAKELGIECEYRTLPGYQISQFEKGTKDHEEDVKTMKEEADAASQLGLNVEYRADITVKGWDGKLDQRDATIFKNQATFHPTKYLNGMLGWLAKQDNFQCFTHTRVLGIEEKSTVPIVKMGNQHVEISTLDGHTIKCEHAVQATCIPLQKLSLVAEMEYLRTYCIAIRIPKGVVEDCLLYDSAEAYKYTRMTECDEKDDYMVVGGCDHEVGQEQTTGRFEELEQWTRARFTQAGSVDYKWSGQIFEPVDYMAFIGKNQGQDRIYVVTGDSGNGLTHGVIASKVISDQIAGTPSPWAAAYDPSRKQTILKSAKDAIGHVLQANAQYKRFLQSDITDIEDLAPGEGGVLNPTFSKPIAVYKDEGGIVTKFSALCPHMKGVVCWNTVEKSWDCPVHGSRFSKEGVQVIGPAKAGLQPHDEEGEKVQKVAVEA